MNEKRLGVVVQQARRAAGYTQQTLCQKSGLSYSTLAKIERGAIKSPSVFTIQIIAQTLNVTLDDLLSQVQPVLPSHSKKVSKSGVRFIYFDMNGCLVRYGTRALGLIAQAAGKTSDVVESTYWRYDSDLCRGVATVDELNAALSAALETEVDWPSAYLDSVEAVPGMAELLVWTAEHYRVGILTNTLPGLVEIMRARGILPDVPYDVIVDSSVVHALKPEPEIFKIAADRAGVEPHEILLIDDDRPNLVAAGKLGWHTIKFDAQHPENVIEAIRAALEPAS